MDTLGDTHNKIENISQDIQQNFPEYYTDKNYKTLELHPKLDTIEKKLEAAKYEIKYQIPLEPELELGFSFNFT